MSDSKKAMTLHVVIGYLKGTVQSEAYFSKDEVNYAKDLLKLIDEELKEEAVTTR